MAEAGNYENENQMVMISETKVDLEYSLHAHTT